MLLVKWVGGVLVLVTLLAWVSGQLRIGLVEVHTELTIDAGPTAVWSVLTRFDDYPEWNPLMVEVRQGEARTGARMEWSSRINNDVRAYDAEVTRVDPLVELSWIGPVSGIQRVLFWGEHRFILENIPGGKIRFINSEQFGGLATIVLASFLKSDVRNAYLDANAALKRRAEALPDS